MKKLIIIFLVIVAIGAGVYWYVNRQLNYLPEWYQKDAGPVIGEGTEQPAPPESETTIDAVSTPESSASAKKEDNPEKKPEPTNEVTPQAEPRLPKSKTPKQKLTARQVTGRLASEDEVRISETELNELIVSSVEKKLPLRTEEFMKAMKSTIDEKMVDVEMVLDVNKVPWEDLPPEFTLAKNLATQFNANASELYVKISGMPVIREDKLAFDDKAKIQIGKIAYPLKTLLATPGFDKFFSGEIPLEKMPFTNVTLEKGAIVLHK